MNSSVKEMNKQSQGEEGQMADKRTKDVQPNSGKETIKNTCYVSILFSPIMQTGI